jgi:hypothetical protein
VLSLIINFAVVVKIRKLSRELGCNPPRFFIYNFLAYAHTQSKHQAKEGLKPWVIACYVLLAISFIFLIGLSYVTSAM